MTVITKVCLCVRECVRDGQEEEPGKVMRMQQREIEMQMEQEKGGRAGWTRRMWG